MRIDEDEGLVEVWVLINVYLHLFKSKHGNFKGQKVVFSCYCGDWGSETLQVCTFYNTKMW